MKIMAAMHGIKIDNKPKEETVVVDSQDHNEINRKAFMQLRGLF